MDKEKIILSQYKAINELRNKMTSFLDVKHLSVNSLFVGEGVNCNSTLLGYCIITNHLPKNYLNINVIDLEFNGDLTFDDDLSFESFENVSINSVHGDATSMPFKDEVFDVIIAPLMIDDCSDHMKLLSEFKRCIKKNSSIILSGHGIDSNTKYKHFSGLLGSTHINQTSIKEIDDILNLLSANILYSWNNHHCWLKVFKF